MILYLNACVRPESRTHRLALALLKKLGAFQEVRLTEAGLAPLTCETLEKRTALIAAGDYTDAMFRWAKQFAAAETIVIAAPFWDGSFPAVLKTYIENIYVTGIVSRYGPDGRPQGLCRAEKLYYVTTSGGPCDPSFGYAYLRWLAADCFGIPKTELVKAEMLDVEGFDAEGILRQAIESL